MNLQRTLFQLEQNLEIDNYLKVTALPKLMIFDFIYDKGRYTGVHFNKTIHFSKFKSTYICVSSLSLLKMQKILEKRWSSVACDFCSSKTIFLNKEKKTKNVLPIANAHCSMSMQIIFFWKKFQICTNHKVDFLSQVFQKDTFFLLLQFLTQ